MRTETHPYYYLSLADCVALLFSRDKHIEQLNASRATDRQTISEYRKLIWGNKNEKHISILALQDLDSAQEELPFNHLPELQTTVLLRQQQQYKGNIKSTCVQ